MKVTLAYRILSLSLPVSFLRTLVTSAALEMALFRRQVVDPQIYDDQSPTLSGLFVGNWTPYTRDGYKNNTLTATATPGASLSFTFLGVYRWPGCVEWY